LRRRGKTQADGERRAAIKSGPRDKDRLQSAGEGQMQAKVLVADGESPGGYKTGK